MSQITTTLPAEVEDRINFYMQFDVCKKQEEALNILQDVFKQAVLNQIEFTQPTLRNEMDEEKSEDSYSSDSENDGTQKKLTVPENENFTLDKVLKILGRTNKNTRSRDYDKVLKDATEYRWRSKIISMSKFMGSQKPCNIWFTPAGFIRCFFVFPKSDLSKHIMNVQCEITSWVMLCKAKSEIRLKQENALLLEAKNGVEDDFDSRGFSPFKDLCRAKGFPVSMNDWSPAQKRRARNSFWPSWSYAKTRWISNRGGEGNYVYNSKQAMDEANEHWMYS